MELAMVDLLQQVGLNKYEAEAYAALLQHGPLTGYELVKRSEVPLSRSYEILERLASKGLALVQPGDPQRLMRSRARWLTQGHRPSRKASGWCAARPIFWRMPMPVLRRRGARWRSRSRPRSANSWPKRWRRRASAAAAFCRRQPIGAPN